MTGDYVFLQLHNFCTILINHFGSSMIRTFSDFFTNEGQRCKNICLVGEPGSVKTTFIKFTALNLREANLNLLSCIVHDNANNTTLPTQV